jgi:hypothetical protein
MQYQETKLIAIFGEELPFIATINVSKKRRVYVSNNQRFN